MSVIDGKFNFYDVKLVSKNKNGKLYFQVPKNKSKVYAVSEDIFKHMLIVASNAKQFGYENSNMANTLDYLLQQIEMTEDIFSAMLYEEWINENKE